MNIYAVIDELINYAIERELIEKTDAPWARGSLMALLGISDFKECESVPVRELSVILSQLCDYAYENGIIKKNSVAYRDLFDTSLMGVFVDRPSCVTKKFRELYKISPSAATDYFYKLCIGSNYIRSDRIKKDLKWTVSSEYGELDITVNLSKPEKDPKAIAAAKLLPQSGYPKCMLCIENVGYAGTLSKPARQNLRSIAFDMSGDEWYLQYSPYVYYNEHCIAFSGEHTPMQINRATFKKLLSFVSEFPHYFIGSNADLPIVGGSILSHDHMQGGRYTFAMERALPESGMEISFNDYPEVDACILKWPMSVIRLSSLNKHSLVSLADRILTAWRGYTDPSVFIHAYTDGVPHNTITPIARRRGERFELDLVLRNNITTQEHPLGVYHPHAELHNIKKENIGLIEVMGLAVLPSRLKSEIDELKAAILSGTDLKDSSIAHHAAWLDTFKESYTFTEENTEEILRTEIGKTFVRVLEDSGVFKRTPEGKSAFLRFISKVNEG